jgi:hypothetical protein
MMLLFDILNRYLYKEDIQQLLRERGLSSTGNKSDLIDDLLNDERFNPADAVACMTVVEMRQLCEEYRIRPSGDRPALEKKILAAIVAEDAKNEAARRARAADRANRATSSASVAAGGPQIALPVGARSWIDTLPFGAVIFADIEELNGVSRLGFASASMALWGKVVDGLIKARGHKDHWWKEEWDNLPLGRLLGENAAGAEIVKTIGSGLLGRLKDKARYIRNPSAHQLYTRISVAEAHGAMEVLVDFVRVWL